MRMLHCDVILLPFLILHIVCRSFARYLPGLFSVANPPISFFSLVCLSLSRTLTPFQDFLSILFIIGLFIQRARLVGLVFVILITFLRNS